MPLPQSICIGGGRLEASNPRGFQPHTLRPSSLWQALAAQFSRWGPASGPQGRNARRPASPGGRTGQERRLQPAPAARSAAEQRVAASRMARGTRSFGAIPANEVLPAARLRRAVPAEAGVPGRRRHLPVGDPARLCFHRNWAAPLSALTRVSPPAAKRGAVPRIRRRPTMTSGTPKSGTGSRSTGTPPRTRATTSARIRRRAHGQASRSAGRCFRRATRRRRPPAPCFLSAGVCRACCPAGSHTGRAAS